MLNDEKLREEYKKFREEMGLLEQEVRFFNNALVVMLCILGCVAMVVIFSFIK